jgi:hypothetical protein
MNRTAFVGSVAALSLAGMLPVRADAIDMTAFHCGSSHDCCSHWCDKARLHGFRVALYSATDDVRAARYQIPRSLLTCHTAVVGDYIFEGHVPFDIVDRILAERPSIRGVAIPGVPPPLGLPGMEGRWPEPIDVIILDDPKKVYVTLPITG